MISAPKAGISERRDRNTLPQSLQVAYTTSTPARWGTADPCLGVHNRLPAATHDAQLGQDMLVEEGSSDADGRCRFARSTESEARRTGSLLSAAVIPHYLALRRPGKTVGGHP